MLESAVSNVSKLICYLREDSWHDEMCAFEDTTDGKSNETSPNTKSEV